MLFSLNWLQELVKTQLPKPEALADDLALHVFEVEGIEKKGDDVLFDVTILPQRADCLSHQGLAREICAIEKKELQELEYVPLKVQKGNLPSLKVVIESRDFVQRYAALVVEGIALAPSPQWMQKRLESLGINPINNIVDITNFVMLELGQPLHAFDFGKIQGNFMRVRETRSGEKLELLDDTEMVFPKGVLVIEDEKRLIDLAGIKGGKVSSIGKTTRSVVLQAATFDPKKIYQTVKLINYRTSAADIYAHGVDPNLAEAALARAAFLLNKFGGGKIVQFIDIYPKKRKPLSIVFPKSAVEKLLGADIPAKDMVSILSRLGFKVAGPRVLVPTWRQDVAIVEDLVEEVGRIYGFHTILAKFPQAHVVPPEENQEQFWLEKVKDTLKEVGLTELYNYSFIGEKDISSLLYSVQDQGKLIELQNPMSEDFKFLRVNLLDNLLKNIAFNEKAFQGKDMKLFEVGKVFEKTQKGFDERTMIGVVLSPTIKSRDAFFEAKGVVDLLFARLGITDSWYDEFQAVPDRGRSNLWQKGKSAEIKVGQKEIGFLGEISSAVLANKGIERQVVAFEIDAQALLIHALEEREYRPPSRFPPALRDIALFVPREIKVEDVLNVMERAGGSLVADIDLFDMYEGEELQNSKKSLAFHIVYQAEDKTLRNEEVDTLHTKIIKALEENPEWEVRK
ncbi:MAG: phenylalanine--tRNA ligase subunit beta [bacterium]|nr:phenylalanine--tRNA ligase subunit beta [bacterium]